MFNSIAIELVEPTKRDFCTIVSNIAYSIGLTLLAGVVHIFRGWKALSLAVSLPFLSLFIFYYFIPESPRWLISRNRFKDAASIMKNMARLVLSKTYMFFIILLILISE